ncbi:unnamed protein product [Schistocephalus solidus]|uniref:Endo/exonuclease/phosphatase domain-containing protein n=1 Tax=Schistocephalus solidus TaxID=70667 RepID=A0A183TEQ0_SCHSO|nr:unnamed protein product [Schistocephalus solidus]
MHQLPVPNNAIKEFFTPHCRYYMKDPRRDLLIGAGDWNGRTGPVDSTNRHLIGRFELCSRCENVERLLNFADQYRLFVTNACFQHCNKHLLNWFSNGGHTTSRIDYILVSSRFRSRVQDSRSVCGVETRNVYMPDHDLVRTRLKVHLSSAPKMPRARRLDFANIRWFFRSPDQRYPVMFY